MRYLRQVTGFLPLLFASWAYSEDWTYIEEISGTPQGGIIIRYPDVAEPRARSFGQQLRHHGWSSLLVPLPASLAGQMPPTPSEAPIDFIKQEHGQLNLVLLTVGDAWDASLKLEEFENAEGNIERPIQAVILVDVPGDFSHTPNIPTLDIQTTPFPVFGYERRQQIVRRERITSAQGVTLRYSTRKPARPSRTESESNDNEDFLTRRIRGWLHHNARGMALTAIEP